MSTLFRRVVAVAGIAAMTTGLAACTATAESTKAGGAGPPTTLRIGTADLEDRPGAVQINDFAAHVEELTDGRVVIELVAEAAGPSGSNPDDWDQVVARAVTGGELDGGNIPTRAWDTEGVDSLRALTAPFLIGSNDVMAAVVTDPVASEMLSALGEIGVVGLALFPEGLRHVFAFGDPLSAPEDFDGAAIRAPMSATTYAVFEALGATPDDYPGPDAYFLGVSDGTITATESSFGVDGLTPPIATVTANLPFFAKVNSLVLRTEVWNGLSGDEQAALLEAAELTQQSAIAGLNDEATVAAAYCVRGGTVLVADETELESFHEATAPVLAMLREDADTARFIDRIAALSSDVEPSSALVEPCAFEQPSATTDPGDSAVTDVDVAGVYRGEWTEEYIIESGLPELARAESGVHTITLTPDGEITDEYPNGHLCLGTYEVDGDRLTWRYTAGCTGDFTATVAVDGDTLTMTDIVAIPPWDTADDQVIVEVFWSVPLTRIADADES